jgi:hypothetical protein
VMTMEGFTSAIRSFAEALLLEAQLAHFDSEKIDIMWESAERMFFNTLHYLEEYSPIFGATLSVVEGLKVRRPTGSPLTSEMDKVLPSWRTLPSMKSFAGVGLSKIRSPERYIKFEVPCDPNRKEDLPEDEENGDLSGMKQMPLRMRFGA